MPPLPTLWDPAGAVDKLPQPFRLIDKILADIVEQVVDLIGKREQRRKLEEAAKVNLTFAPHAVMEVPWAATKFLPVGIGGIAAVALPDGELRVHSARDASSSFSDRTTHSSAITALEAGIVVTTSGRLLAAASRTTLSVHEVDIKACQLALLASVPLPLDPEDESSPVGIYWSHTLGHLAVCYGSGALVLFAVHLPVPNVNSMDNAGAILSLSLAAFGTSHLEELLQVPMATARAFCLGSPELGASHVVWQLQQRPDKSPHSDRYHKSARGAYVWWEGSGRLLLIDIPAAAATRSAAGTQPHPPPEPESAPPTKPLPKSISTKAPHTPEAGAGAGGGAAAATGPVATTSPPHGEPAGPPRMPPIAPLARDWLFPHDITAAAATSDHKTLAWGLADGSVLLWDDRSTCTIKVLPRLKGAITSLGWVNGVAHKLMCASAQGNIFIADIIKPEDSSQKVYEFPQPIHAIHFLPNEPFALCICRGHSSSDGVLAASVSGSAGGADLAGGGGSGVGGAICGILGGVQALRPRVIWFNVLEEKPVAELMGPQAGQSFGLACCVPAPPPPEPPPPAEPAAASGAGGSTAGAAATAAAAAPPAPRAAAGEAAGNAGDGGAGAAPSGKQAVLNTLTAMAVAAAAGPVRVPVALELPAGEAVVYPALAFRDTYLVVGGDVVDKVVHSNFADESAVPQRVVLLYMYKVDALLRHLLPEDEMHSKLGKVVLDRLLADLEAPKVNKKKGKRVTMDVEDPDAPKLPSSMRKPDPFDDGVRRPSSRATNRHITFGSMADELFDDTASGTAKKPKEIKVFPKETRKGLKTSPDDIALVNKDRRGSDGKPRLAPLGLEKAKEEPPPFAERSQSPPWHHTNPLARIHPDWEEAPVLIRIMDRIGSKGGGRKRRDKRLETLTAEMMAKFAKEAGAKPNLYVDLSSPAPAR